MRRRMRSLLLPACLGLALLLPSAAARALPTEHPAAPAAAPASRPLPPLLEQLERRTFDYFWDTANRANGLVPDRWPGPSPCSIAAVGFALTAYPIGVERGYITRQQAAQRVLVTLRFFARAPQGPQPEGVTGYKGFFYHFLDMRSGVRTSDSELSTVDTALLLAGVLSDRDYFDRATPEEREIRTLADAINRRVDWRWASPRAPLVSMGWMPESGFIPHDWQGYDEAMILYLLALGSPTHAVAPAAWPAWTATYDRTWGTFRGQTYLGFGPLFGYQYSQSWVDFRGIRDAWMQAHDLDYFENSRRATLAQHAYAIANPMGWRGYDKDIWGLTASDGPANYTRFMPPWHLRRFRGYSARGVDLRGGFDDGTIAPTAMVSSIAFAPELVIPSIAALDRRYGRWIYGKYGFVDAFNPSFSYDVPLRTGRLVKGVGWVDSEYLGIDQGPILLMLENYRSGFVWQLMRGDPDLRRGLQRAGFRGGWLQPASAQVH